MHILFIHQHVETQDMVTFFLEEQFGGEVRWTYNSSEAVDLMLEDHLIDMVICEDNSASAKFYKFLLSTDSQLPCILIRPNSDENPKAFPDLNVIGTAGSVTELETLKGIIQEAVVDGTIAFRESDKEFLRIRLNILIKMIPLQADVYIRLSGAKYVKLFRKGNTFKKEDAQRYFKKNIQYLYVKKGETEKLVIQMQKSIIDLANVEDASQDYLLNLAGSVHESLIELSRNLGFTEEVQEIAKQSVDLTLKGIGRHPKLSNLLKMVTSSESEYLSTHSMMLAHVTCSLASKLDWPSDTTFRKLVLASLLHDVMIADSKMAEMTSVEEIRSTQKNYSAEDMKNFLNHPHEAAEVLKQFRETPPEVDMIIAQHHERCDGTGFPKGLRGNYIAPLAALFIVAHDLVKFAWDNKKIEDFKALQRQFKASRNYTTSNFLRVFNAIDLVEL